MAYTKKQRAANAAKQKAEGGSKQVPPSATPKIKVAEETKEPLSLKSLVKVVNGHNGTLVYKSKKNVGFKIVFENFGDFDEIEMGELLSAKNTQPEFFSNNWFLIEDQDVIEYLRVGKFYKNALKIEDFDEIFKRSDKDLLEAIESLSSGQKSTLSVTARKKVDSGEIDSIKKIETLEKALGCSLREI